MVDLLTEDPTLSAEQRESVNSIQLSAKALLTIVNDILDFSKIESGRFDIEELPFNLSSTVSGLCQLLTMFARQKGLNFVYENSLDENVEFIGDAGRIRQVLSNLLMNALKFTAKGVVKILVSGETLGTRMDDRETVQVKFVVEDTGIGIEKHVLDRLFTPFHQGDASTARLYGGTGLGLTISQNVSVSFMQSFLAIHFTNILSACKINARFHRTHIHPSRWKHGHFHPPIKGFFLVCGSSDCAFFLTDTAPSSIPFARIYTPRYVEPTGFRHCHTEPYPLVPSPRGEGLYRCKG